MTRRDKLFLTLDTAEAELRALLVKHLRATATGEETLLFVTPVSNPWPELRSGSPAGTEIVMRANQIVELAAKLGVATDDLVATKVVRYFGGANDVSNDHRLGPIRLARKLLDELGET